MKFEITLQSGSMIAKREVKIFARPPAAPSGRAEFKLGGVALEVDWAEVEPGVYSLILGTRCHVISVWPSAASGASSRGSLQVTVRGRTLQVEVRSPLSRRGGSDASHNAPLEILAPMPGRIVKILAPEGAAVGSGRGLIVIEAMKMQNEIRAPRAGSVHKIHVSEGQGVEAGARLVSIG